jgi:hypothetical protein
MAKKRNIKINLNNDLFKNGVNCKSEKCIKINTLKMDALLKQLSSKKIVLDADIVDVCSNCKKLTVFNTTEELADASTGGKENMVYEVSYDVPGKGMVKEAYVHRVKNGIAANYVEPYMRRRDPDTMVIADDRATDKVKFNEKFGYEFSKLQKETFDWLKNQELAVFFYFAGRENIGMYGAAIAPANAGFFALGLGLLQQMTPVSELPEGAQIETVIYVAPPFRHTHFNGTQVVVHNRKPSIHEMYSYNLYPGPSAKKGLYGALLNKGEKEGWITAHCSTVQVISPYDNVTTFMHEGASGGGKTEMLQHVPRQEDGTILIGKNTVTGEHRNITIPIFCKFAPVTDDMALCHPSVQQSDGKLRVVDAENSWFIRVDGVNGYGDDAFLEKTSINPPSPLLFLNIDAMPGSTALIWDHIEDAPGKRCPNPRIVLPRESVPNVVSGAVKVDIRSFGVRTPPCTKELPSYGIVGMFHLLPPALAWLWRLVAPRGHANPSIVSDGSMKSEGVGSYWPFATGEMVHHANMLLKQIEDTSAVRYTLVPNQHIGAYKVGFIPQLMMREYLTRRGNAKLKSDQYQDARCSILGSELNYLTIEGNKIPSRFLKVYKQDEVGFEGYDKGAAILTEFFKQEVRNFDKPNISALGRKIIDACLQDATVKDYEALLPNA